MSHETSITNVLKYEYQMEKINQILAAITISIIITFGLLHLLDPKARFS